MSAFIVIILMSRVSLSTFDCVSFCLASICASNDQRTGALYSVAANLFGAVKIVLYRRTQTLVVRSMYEAIIDFCERHEVDFNR